MRLVGHSEKDSYYKAQFNRLRAKRGPKKAICAVAASMLTAIYHMLKDGTNIATSGAAYFDAVRPRSKPIASSPNSPSSASRSSFNPSPRRRETPNFQAIRRTRGGNKPSHEPPNRAFRKR